MNSPTENGEWLAMYRASKKDDWHILARHADYATAWGLLLDAVADRRQHGSELLVSRTVPDSAPAGPRRRRF